VLLFETEQLSRRELADEVLLGICVSACVTLGILFYLAGRNLKEMSERIREHNQTSQGSFGRVSAALARIEEILQRFR
jgi:hypothetical protein